MFIIKKKEEIFFFLSFINHLFMLSKLKAKQSCFFNQVVCSLSIVLNDIIYLLLKCLVLCSSLK